MSNGCKVLECTVCYVTSYVTAQRMTAEQASECYRSSRMRSRMIRCFRCWMFTVSVDFSRYVKCVVDTRSMYNRYISHMSLTNSIHDQSTPAHAKIPRPTRHFAMARDGGEAHAGRAFMSMRMRWRRRARELARAGGRAPQPSASMTPCE